jgi:hypothetical protein
MFLSTLLLACAAASAGGEAPGRGVTYPFVEGGVSVCAPPIENWYVPLCLSPVGEIGMAYKGTERARVLLSLSSAPLAMHESGFDGLRVPLAMLRAGALIDAGSWRLGPYLTGGFLDYGLGTKVQLPRQVSSDGHRTRGFDLDITLFPAFYHDWGNKPLHSWRQTVLQLNLSYGISFNHGK